MGDRGSSFRAVRRKRNFIHKRMREQIDQYHERTEGSRKTEYKRKHLSVKDIENELMDNEIEK